MWRPAAPGPPRRGSSITYAAHVAVMAPGSSIGAAHPVFEGGPAARPTRQTPRRRPAAASRSCCRRSPTSRSPMCAHGRDCAGATPTGPSKPIRESVARAPRSRPSTSMWWTTSPPALTDALDQADGREVLVGSDKVTLHTQGATTCRHADEQHRELPATAHQLQPGLHADHAGRPGADGGGLQPRPGLPRRDRGDHAAAGPRGARHSCRST